MACVSSGWNRSPATLHTPAGTSHQVDYAAPGGPAVEVRVQELFGLTAHPSAGGVPLTLRLLSPARRPIQTTSDLPAFWRGSWSQVAKRCAGVIRGIPGPTIRL